VGSIEQTNYNCSDYCGFSTTKEWNRIASYANSLGMKWTEGKPLFKKGVIIVDNSATLAHELGHWLVAAPHRKQMRYFGLGYDGDVEGLAPASPRLSYLWANTEELLAQLISVSVINTTHDLRIAVSLYGQYDLKHYHMRDDKDFGPLKGFWDLLHDAGLVRYKGTGMRRKHFIPSATLTSLSDSARRTLMVDGVALFRYWKLA
jgi:hypothetical protein